jgi:Asp/Glu/hydantoin racemase
MALGFGHRFGIISILSISIPRHRRYVYQLGLEDHLAGDRAIECGVGELDSPGVIDRVITAGRQLRDLDGALSLVLGCAGMGRWRARVEEALGMPVIDPTRAAVARAIDLLTRRNKHIRQRLPS